MSAYIRSGSRYSSIRIVETGEAFNTSKDCAKYLGVSTSSISQCLSGILKTCGGYHLELIDSKPDIPYDEFEGNTIEIPYAPGYFVSDLGKIYGPGSMGRRDWRELSSYVNDKYGHHVVDLYINGKRIHKYVAVLVAEAFIPNPHNYPEVRHMDGNPHNNKVNNLAWGAHIDNMRDAQRHGTFHYFTPEEDEMSLQVLRTPVRATHVVTGETREFISQADAARELGVYQSNIHHVLSGRYRKTGKWKFEYIKEEEEMPDFINSFPGYEFKDGKNIFQGEDIGRGGYVWSAPGMYGRTITLDVSAMHPHSIIALNYFGEYTSRYKELVDARAAIKHKDYESARKMFGGKLTPYLTDESTAKSLSNALKLAQNSCYGLTAANFDNPMRDIRNKNNIVACRGALTLAMLRREVEERGGTVIHCKTDSIKLVEPTDEIIQFVIDFGKKYGYDFEVEHIFEKICLVNDSTYVAKLASDDPDDPGKWTATAAQFQVPYVFKKLFSKEPIVFEDLCETKSVKTALYLDMNEDLPDVTSEESELANRNYNKGPNPMSGDDWKPKKLNPSFETYSDEDLSEQIAKGHNRIFVGKVGQFCPIESGCGGGLLVREADGRFNSATGAKGYRWMESEMVRELGKESDIDRSYYDRLVDDAVETISKYGDFEQFVSTDSDDDQPPWQVASEPWSREEARNFDVR